MGVRSMRAADCPAVVAMYLSFAHNAASVYETPGALLVWQGDDQTLGGFIHYSLPPVSAAPAVRRPACIHAWFVRPEFRRRGIGSALIAAVENRADRSVGLLHPSHVVIEQFRGSRTLLLPLFEQADDSLAEIQSYCERGEVLVARRSQEIVGHLQLLTTDTHPEIKSIAVLESCRGQGIGSALIREALRRVLSSGALRILVSTATADTAVLRFYQRLGFRMDRVEHDIFTPGRGYPQQEIDGIPLCDRVWLSRDLSDLEARRPGREQRLP